MQQTLPIARSSRELFLLPGLANRHGLITGATGTGKTVTLQVMAKQFSLIGVPVFMSDVKGDLSGLSQPGAMNPKFKARIDGPAAAGAAAESQRHPGRHADAGVQDRRRQPFAAARSEGLRSMVQYVGDNARQFTTEYGNISSASIGAI